MFSCSLSGWNISQNNLRATREATKNGQGCGGQISAARARARGPNGRWSARARCRSLAFAAVRNVCCFARRARTLSPGTPAGMTAKSISQQKMYMVMWPGWRNVLCSHSGWGTVQENVRATSGNKHGATLRGPTYGSAHVQKKHRKTLGTLARFWRT